MSNVLLRLSSIKLILNIITKNFKTLFFCRRYLNRLRENKYLLRIRSVSKLNLELYANLSRSLKLNSLISIDLVKTYSSLNNIKDSYTTRFKHVSCKNKCFRKLQVNKL